MAEQNVTTSMNVLEESENAVNSHCALIKKVGFKLYSYRKMRSRDRLIFFRALIFFDS